MHGNQSLVTKYMCPQVIKCTQGTCKVSDQAPLDDETVCGFQGGGARHEMSEHASLVVRGTPMESD